MTVTEFRKAFKPGDRIYCVRGRLAGDVNQTYTVDRVTRNAVLFHDTSLYSGWLRGLIFPEREDELEADALGFTVTYRFPNGSTETAEYLWHPPC